MLYLTESSYISPRAKGLSPRADIGLKGWYGIQYGFSNALFCLSNIHVQNVPIFKDLCLYYVGIK